jgi:hypothetical protein
MDIGYRITGFESECGAIRAVSEPTDQEKHDGLGNDKKG